MKVLLRRCVRAAGLMMVALAVAGPVGVFSARAGENPAASEWSMGHKSRTRLTAGRAGNLYAFIEIELAEGWKTYWRSPGDSGIPPHIEFGRSKNLGSATVLFPQPRRITVQ